MSAAGLWLTDRSAQIDIWSFGITIYEIAKQNPPLYQYHPERVVDMIPRMPPPRLEGGSWSNPLREFVALCLNEVAAQRPSAEELQKSKFVKTTRAPYTIMQDLTKRYELWERGGGVRASMLCGPGMAGPDSRPEAAVDTAWDFDTVKSRVSGVPKEFEMLSVVQRQTLRGFRPPAPPGTAQFSRGGPGGGGEGAAGVGAGAGAGAGPGTAAGTGTGTGFKPQGGAEKLYRLFQDPKDDEPEPWNDGPPTPAPFRGNGSHAAGMSSDNRSTSSLGMISIPSFDDNGMLLPESSSESLHSSNRSASPLGMISMPTEEEMMAMAMQKASAAAQAAHAASTPLHTPSVIPQMSMPPMADKPTITRTRPPKNDSAGAPVFPSTDAADGSFSQTTITREPPPRRPPAAASAPSSPPRYQAQTPQGNTVAGGGGGGGGMNGHKPHHLSSKSVPTFAGLREETAPPMPTPPKVRSAESTPGPHLKSRSQDITARGHRPGGKLHARPSHLNLGPSGSSNFIESTRLPPSPVRNPSANTPLTAKQTFGFPAMPAAAAAAATAAAAPLVPPPVDMGSLEFPTMAPLDTSVLALAGGSGEMIQELDRVLSGLGDALEVVEVGLGRLHKERLYKVPADEEE